MDAVEGKIREIINDIAGLRPDAAGDADLYLDLGVASVHALQLLTKLEEQFGISVPDEEFVEATTISRLAAMIQNLLVTKPEGAASA